MVGTSDVSGSSSGGWYDKVQSGYVMTRTEADNTRTQLVLDGSGNIIRTVDHRGQVTHYEYYPSGRLKSRTDALGQTYRFTYDAAGRLLTETDPRQKTTRYEYQENGLKVVKTDPLGNTTITRLDLHGRPLSVTDGRGETTRYEYNSSGQLTAISKPGGARATFTYDASGRMIQSVDPRLGVTEYTRDAMGRVTAVRDAGDKTESVTYNAWGKVVEYKNKVGDVTKYEYNAAGQLTKKIEPGTNVTEYTRNSEGLVTAVRDPKGFVTRYDYDARGRLTRVEEPGATGTKVTEYTYDPDGRLQTQKVAQSDGQINFVRYTYDLVGRKTREEFGSGLWIAYTYDANGSLLTRSDSTGATTRYQYDDLNRVSRVDHPDGTWKAYTYDAVGNKLTETGSEGTTTYAYWPDGRLMSTTSPSGSVTELVYDANGNLIGRIVDGQEQKADYDENNRVREITDALGYTYRYEYDADGYVTAIHLPNGLTTHIEYDARHHVEKQWTDHTSGATVNHGDYGYEPRGLRDGIAEDGRNYQVVYDGRGQMQQVTNPLGDVIRYTFDGAGNLTRREAVISGSTTDLGETITVDALMDTLLRKLKEQEGEAVASGVGRLVPSQSQKLAFRSEGVLDIGYGLLAAKGGNSAGGAPADPGPAKAPTDHGDGKAPEERGTGKGADKSPSPREKPEVKGCQGLEHGKGGKIGLYRKCAADLGLKTGLEANLLSIIDNLVNGEYYLPPGDKEELCALVREVAAGYTIVGTTYQYNEKNQLMLRHNLVRDEEHPYKYDARGNLLSNGRTTFVWDDDNHLLQAVFPDGEGVRYQYDAMGRRISRTTFNAQRQGQHTTWFDYEGASWNVARERNKDGETIASYTYDLNGLPMTITYQGSTYWYVFNAHGDVVALTDVNGTVKARYEYDEWGRVQAMYDETGRVREGYGTIGDVGTGPVRPVIGSPTPGTVDGTGKGKKNQVSPDTLLEPKLPEGETGEQGELQIQGVIGEPTDLVKMNPYRYGGYRYDRETQYHYLRARTYDPRLGRFLSQDTWAGDVSRPLTLNRYLYVLSFGTA